MNEPTQSVDPAAFRHFQSIGVVVIMCVVAVVPTIFAAMRRHHQVGPISILNVFFVLMPIVSVPIMQLWNVFTLPFGAFWWVVLLAWSMSWIRSAARR